MFFSQKVDFFYDILRHFRCFLPYFSKKFLNFQQFTIRPKIGKQTFDKNWIKLKIRKIFNNFFPILKPLRRAQSSNYKYLDPAKYLLGILWKFGQNSWTFFSIIFNNLANSQNSIKLWKFDSICEKLNFWNLTYELFIDNILIIELNFTFDLGKSA